MSKSHTEYIRILAIGKKYKKMEHFSVTVILIPTTGGQAPFFVSPARHGEAQNMSGT
jgi:hypothetical protein